MKKVRKVLGIILLVLLLIAGCVYQFVLFPYATGDFHSGTGEFHYTDTSDKLVSNNLTLDCLTVLHEKYGGGMNLMFDFSTRDGNLAKVQNYFDTGVMDVTEKEADI